MWLKVIYFIEFVFYEFDQVLIKSWFSWESSGICPHQMMKYEARADSDGRVNSTETQQGNNSRTHIAFNNKKSLARFFTRWTPPPIVAPIGFNSNPTSSKRSKLDYGEPLNTFEPPTPSKFEPSPTLSLSDFKSNRSDIKLSSQKPSRRHQVHPPSVWVAAHIKFSHQYGISNLVTVKTSCHRYQTSCR